MSSGMGSRSREPLSKLTWKAETLPQKWSCKPKALAAPSPNAGHLAAVLALLPASTRETALP